MTDAQTKRTNGSDERDAKAVEAGLAMHLRVKSELEDARHEIGELRQQLTQNAVAMEGLHSLNNLLESRIEAAVVERDLAVGQRAKLEALFSMISATMREFQIPNVPLIRKMEDKSHAHRTNPA